MNILPENKKNYMCSAIIKHNVPIKTMTARLKVTNAYLPQFPSPKNTAFSTCKMIDIILGAIPKYRQEKMVTAKVELMNHIIKELVDHLENLET